MILDPAICGANSSKSRFMQHQAAIARPSLTGRSAALLRDSPLDSNRDISSTAKRFVGHREADP